MSRQIEWTELYKEAIGPLNQEYYLKIFDGIDNRSWGLFFFWNQSAFFFGPLWMHVRRFPEFELYITALVVMIACNGLIDNPGYLPNVVSPILLYLILYPMSANYRYHRIIRKFINKHETDMETLRLLVRDRFSPKFNVERYEDFRKLFPPRTKNGE